MSDFANGLAKPQTPEAVQLIRPATTIRAGIALLAVSVGAIQFVLEHGEREDWFDSRQIVALSVIGVVGWCASSPRTIPPSTFASFAVDGCGSAPCSGRDVRGPLRHVLHAAGVPAVEPAHVGAEWTAHQRALALLDRQLLGQASVIAYSRIYVIAAGLILLLIPLLFPVRQTRSAGTEHVMVE